MIIPITRGIPMNLRKQKTNLALLALFGGLFASTSSQACTPAEGRDAIDIKKFTFYMPSEGGINGSCGTSASGKDACKYSLEDYLNGRSRVTMVAIPRRDRSNISGYFGGVFRATSLEKYLGIDNCILISPLDVYGPKNKPTAWMDVVVEKRKNGEKFNRRSGKIVPVGRNREVPAPEREVERKAEAEAPVSDQDLVELALLVKQMEEINNGN